MVVSRYKMFNDQAFNLFREYLSLIKNMIGCMYNFGMSYE